MTLSTQWGWSVSSDRSEHTKPYESYVDICS
jgi:hypothetical protein